jgi:hypothetical protein
MTQELEIKRCYSCGSDNVSIRDYGSGGKDGVCNACGAHDFLLRWNKRIPEDNHVKEIIVLENEIGKLIKIIGELKDKTSLNGDETIKNFYNRTDNEILE